jgi:hypothetical protein
MKQMISLIAVFFMLNTVKAQDQQLAAAVAKLNTAASIADYQQLANEFGRLAAAAPTQWLPAYYAAYSNTRIAFLQKDPERAMQFSNLAEEQIKKAEAIVKPVGDQKELAEVYTVYSFVNRSRVEADPMVNGRKYGPAAGAHLGKARQLDPTNPRALYLDGLVKFKTPAMWGGDKKKAKELFEQALKQFEVKPASAVAPQWGRADCEKMIR